MKPFLYILWDASHIWGLMALHTVQSMQLPFRLINSKDITHGLLLRKPPNLLLVPGGTASIKSKSLGTKGRTAICDYVKAGGKYFGFCGGAGLGLSNKEGLGLCPWKRAVYSSRIQHLVSGHVHTTLCKHDFVPEKLNNNASLPVWWPGFFEEEQGSDVEILATFKQPDDDLCLADIRLSMLPEYILNQWQEVYGVNMGVDFLLDHPCVVSGNYGKGQYVLSYAHLETPNSAEANILLSHILRSLANIECAIEHSPPWDIKRLPIVWEKSIHNAPLHDFLHNIQEIMALGRKHKLLFVRNSWLHGWRTGIPGSALNNIYTSLASVLSMLPSEAAMEFWLKEREKFAKNMQIFWQGTESYLLSERLATTLDSQVPGVINKHMLTEQRHMLFGKPMHAGGLYQELLDVLDELIFLSTPDYT